MIIAVTRLKEKAGKDTELCKKYGHSCRIVSPMEAKVYTDRVVDFAARVNRNEFDCIFFICPGQVDGNVFIAMTNEDKFVAVG